MKKQLNADKNSIQSSNHRRKGETKTTNRNWHLIADQLKHWSLLQDSFILEEFYTSLDIPERTFYDNLKSNKELAAAHEFAMTRIGINREKHCIKHNLNINHVVAYMLPRHFKRWREEIEWRAKIKEEQNIANAEIIKEVLKEVLAPIEEKKDERENSKNSR